MYFSSRIVVSLYFLHLAAAVWPQPKTYETGSRVLWMPTNLNVLYQAHSTPMLMRDLLPTFETFLSPSPVDDLTDSREARYVSRQASTAGLPSSLDILQAAVARMKTNVYEHSLVPWRFYPRGVNFDPPAGQKSFLTSLTINYGPTYDLLSNKISIPTADETYSLSIPSNGSVVIYANTPIGALRALETFTQLFYQDSSSSAGVYTPLVPVNIQDTPVFSHRGVNLDIARNYMAPSDIMRTLDSMALNKFNHLHLHASDGQSWPLEIPALPLLSQNGAYYAGLTWSVADLQAVQLYGYERGIQVYLEIDSPGHTAAIHYGYPDLIAAFDQQPWSPYAAEPPSGQLKLDSPAVTEFIKTLYGDLLPRTSPYTTLFHTGGDEINAEVYTLDPTVRSNNTQTIAALLQKFISNAHSLVRANNLTPMVWEETLLQWNVSLSSDVIVQTWQGQSSLDATIAAGHYALFGDYFHWYLDCGYGQWLDHNITNPNTPIAPPYTDYCDPLKNWREIYSYDPVQNYTAAQKKLVLGGEIHMWGELNDPTSLDSKLWPRAGAAAEILWSGTTGPAGVSDAVTTRLAEMRERLVLRGVDTSMVQMTWCLQNYGNCTL